MEDIGVPHCDTCRKLLDPVGDDEHPYWWCSSCKAPRILSERAPRWVGTIGGTVTT
jgi:hypothetical protein